MECTSRNEAICVDPEDPMFFQIRFPIVANLVPVGMKSVTAARTIMNVIKDKTQGRLFPLIVL